MKRWLGVAAVVACLVMAMSTMVSAADTKIGYVDFGKLQTESKAGIAASKTIETMFKDKQTQLDQRQKDLEKQMDEMEERAPMLSEDARRQMEDKLQKNFKDLQRFKADSEEELNKKKAEVAQQMLVDINDVITKFGKQEGYTLILERSVVLYAPDAVDITDKIIQAYDKTKG